VGPLASWPVSCLRGPRQGRCASPSAMALRATLDPARSSTGEKRAGGPEEQWPSPVSTVGVGCVGALGRGRVRVSPARRVGSAACGRWGGARSPSGGTPGRFSGKPPVDVPASRRDRASLGDWQFRSKWQRRVGGIGAPDTATAWYTSANHCGWGDCLPESVTLSGKLSRFSRTTPTTPPWARRHWVGPYVRGSPTGHERGARCPTYRLPIAAWPGRRACEARPRPTYRRHVSRAPLPTPGRPPALPWPLARFFPVLERGVSRVARRAIAEGDAQRP